MSTEATPAQTSPAELPITSGNEMRNEAKECQQSCQHNLQDPFASSSGKGAEDMADLKMSRGERPEADINWDKLENLFVLDEMGNKIRFTDVFKKQKTIIFFVRHFLDFICKEYVEDVAVIPFEYLQNADVRIVVIGPAPHEYIKPFKKLTGLTYTLYVDPEREIYKALGCLEKMVAGPLNSSKHIKSGLISGVANSVWRAMRSGKREFQGDVKQQGGSFVFGPGNVCHFNHIDQSATDHCPINDVLAQAGVMVCSFPKDPRIQVI